MHPNSGHTFAIPRIYYNSDTGPRTMKRSPSSSFGVKAMFSLLSNTIQHFAIPRIILFVDRDVFFILPAGNTGKLAISEGSRQQQEQIIKAQVL